MNDQYFGDDENTYKCIAPSDNPFNVPSVEYIHPLPGPTTLELAKALRDCFKATGGKVPTAPLDELIERYDFTIDIKIDMGVDDEQLEANRNIAPIIKEPMSTFDMGLAGVAIERTAHENTLVLLRRARDLLLRRQTSDEVESLLTDISEQCPVLNEDK